MRFRIALILTALTAPSALSAEPLADAVGDRFSECYATETGEDLDPAVLEALGAVSGALAESVHGSACDDAGLCTASVLAADCDTLADAWTAAISPPDPGGDAPDWAIVFGDAIIEQVGRCYAEETGSPPGAAESLALDAYGAQLAGTLGRLVASMGCEAHAEGSSACAASIRSQPCDAFVDQLFAGENAWITGEDTPCAEMFHCDSDVLDGIETGGGASATGD